MNRSDKAPATIRLYSTTHEDFPLKLVDVVELFLHELHERGIEQEWYCRNRTPGPLRRVAVGATPVIVPPWTTRFGAAGKLICHALYYVVDLAALTRFVWKPVDVIQARDKYVAAVFGLLIARLRGRVFTVWLSFPFPEYELDTADSLSGIRRVFKRLSGHIGSFALYRVAMPRADHCFVQSEQMKLELHQNYGLPLASMTAVPMGVATRMSKAAAQAARAMADVHADNRLVAAGTDDADDAAQIPTVIYTGSFDRARGLETMIDAFIDVARRHATARFVMVGRSLDAADGEKLQARVAQAGMQQRFEFTGQLPIEETWARVQAADVCVSPCPTTRALRVASPTKLIEYLALGKPAVANDHPDQSRVLRESGGGLCVPMTVDGFAHAIMTLLDEPDMARAMGERGREWVLANRSYDRIADNVHAVYTRLLAERR